MTLHDYMQVGQGTRMIRFDAVSKRYPDGTVAVDELSLEIPEGEVAVLVGTSGAARRPRCG